MKKFFIVLSIITFTASASLALDIIPKAGVDIPTNIMYDGSPATAYDTGKEQETKVGFNIGLEIRCEISKYFSWGAGIDYLFNRGWVKETYTDFSFVPLYASMIFYPLGEWDMAKPYVKLNGGYNVLAWNALGENMEGRLYWGGGIGAYYKNFVGELFASQHFAEFEDPNTIEMKYTKIGFTIGYRIDALKLFKNSEEN